MVADAKQSLPTKAELLEYAVVEDQGENSLKTWHNYYRERRAKLLTFLDHAIAIREPIRCSI